jgi:ABC-2 type transport system permease protein
VSRQGFAWPRAQALALTELRHIRRDPFTLGIAFGLPLVLVLFFGYAMDFNVRHVRLQVLDQDKTSASRELLQLLSGSGYFDLENLGPTEDPRRRLDQEQAKGALIIPPGFSERVGQGHPAAVQILLDGADNQTTGIILGYLQKIENEARARVAGGAQALWAVRYLFNPELNSRWFVVPGLLAVVIGMLAILLTALTIAREWETGSMELLLATPAAPLEIIIGKVLPYLGLVLGSVGLVYLIARWQFALPFRGSHLVFLLGVGLFLSLCLAQGLLISVLTRQQQLAMQLSFISGLLPAMLLSGFIFPIESMEPFFRYLTVILAPRWFVEISRASFLKAAGLRELLPHLGMLALLNLLFIVVALRRFKKDLEEV